MQTKKHTLVLGGTGKTGSRVAQRLTQLGWPVRIGSRSASPAFDWEDQQTWMPALEGMEAVYDVAVAALTQEGHINQLYEVTGPRLLTFADAIAIIAKATGRTIQFEHIPMEAYAATLREYQLPEELISLITYLFTEVLDGRNTYVTNDVERVLGRPARDFADYAHQTAASGAWAVPA